jgi:chemotaxis protein methyltransferase CheR
MSLSHDDFCFIRTLIHEQAAISLDDGKEYLAEARLGSLARSEGADSINELIIRVRADTRGILSGKVVEAMTTNETSFFRDTHPFEALRKIVLPELMSLRGNSRLLRIWCAACSSGQEPYSLAMLLRDSFPTLQDWDVRIMATDLSGNIVERAKSGKYSQMEVNRGVPATMLVRHFQRDGLHWTVSDDIRRMVEFRTLNLISDWPWKEPFDLVLIRNVLIYFNVSTKQQILSRISRSLRPRGYMILGGAETTWNLDDSFERIASEHCTLYRRGALAPGILAPPALK